MNETTISVIIPVYNVEKFICNCVESILKQTYTDIEIILVDDGSTDSSGKICDTLKKKDNRIKVVHKKNGGLSDARNKGIDIATGGFISFVDSDDWIEPDTLEVAYNTIKDEKSDIVVYGICNNYDDGTEKKYPVSERACIDKKTALIYLNSYKGINISACNKVYRMDLFKEIRFPFGKRCEDFYVMYKIFDCANKVSLLPEVKYHYFQRKNSITHDQVLNMDYIYAANEQVEYFKINHTDILFAAMTTCFFSNLVMYNLKVKKNISFDRRRTQKEMRVYRKYIAQNKYLSFSRKLQFYFFTYMPNLYDMYLKIKLR